MYSLNIQSCAYSIGSLFLRVFNSCNGSTRERALLIRLVCKKAGEHRDTGIYAGGNACHDTQRIKLFHS